MVRRAKKEKPPVNYIAIGVDTYLGSNEYSGTGQTPEEAYDNLVQAEEDGCGDGINDDSVIVYKVEAFGKIQRKIEVDFLTVASLEG